jgi:hypothetical protein
MSMQAQLMNDIERFLRETEMNHYVFSERACGDRHVVRRLRAGTTITLRTADKLRSFMSTHAASRGTHVAA